MNERGFTLADLLVSVAIIGIVMAGILALQVQGQLAYLSSAARVEGQQNARIGLGIMTQELRSGRSVTTCSATSLSFTDASNTAITYTLSGNVLQRTVAAGTPSELVGGVSSLAFTCYQSDGYTATTTGSAVKSVQIALQTQAVDAVGTTSKLSQKTVVESRVRLRNF